MTGLPTDGEPGRRLDSWKEIAVYLGVSVRTAHRWEREEGLPIHRHQHAQRASVHAYEGELDDWRRGRDARQESQGNAARKVRLSLGVVWVVSVLVALLAGLWLARNEVPRRHRPRRYELPVVPDQSGWSENDDYSRPVLSPTAESIAFVRAGRVWLRNLETLEASPLEDTAGAERVLWSPDGQEVGFVRLASSGVATLWRVPVSGGPATRICSLPELLLYGAAWGEDGRIVAAMTNLLRWDQAALRSVPAAGGDLLPLSAPTAVEATGALYPSYLPIDGSLLVAQVSEGGDGALAIWSDEGPSVLVDHPGEILAFPAYHPSGYVLYQRGLPESDGVWAIEVDLKRLRAAGAPFLVAENGSMPSVAKDGTFLYVAIEGQNRQQLVWVDRNGSLGEPVGQPMRAIDVPRISADGRRALVAGETSGNVDVWVYELDRPLRTRLTTHSAYDFDPEWSPDGQKVIFSSTRNGATDLFEVRADGSGPIVTRLSDTDSKWASRFTEDGSHLFFHIVKAGNVDISYLSDGSVEPTAYLDSTALEGMPTPAPNGRWLAYVSGPTPPSTDIWVGPLLEAEGRRQVSFRTGQGPVWGPSSEELFFVEGNLLMVAEISPALDVGIPHLVFDASPLDILLARAGNGRARYDVSPDGQRFLAIRDIERRGMSVVVVEDWVPDS